MEALERRHVVSEAIMPRELIVIHLKGDCVGHYTSGNPSLDPHGPHVHPSQFRTVILGARIA